MRRAFEYVSAIARLAVFFGVLGILWLALFGFPVWVILGAGALGGACQ